MATQEITIEFPFGSDYPALHCPACGSVMVAGRHQAEPESYCEHLRFVFLGSICELLYADDRIWEIADRVSADGDDDDEGLDGDGPEPGGEELEDEEASVLELITRELDSRTSLVFSITTGGMACGPVWETIFVGVDLFPDDKPRA